MPPPNITFFIDKCLGTKIVPEKLRNAGFQCELKTDHFPPDTFDHVWIPEVGKRGWVILTKDKYLRHNYLEISALLKSQTHSFVLTSGNYSGAEMGDTITKAARSMTKMVAKFPAPFVGKILRGGRVEVSHTHDDLIQSISSKRGG